MNEKHNENIITVIALLGEQIRELTDSVQSKLYYIKSLEREVADLKGLLEGGNLSDQQYESTIKRQSEYIENLEAKIYDLEERIAIMAESEAPAPDCKTEPPTDEIVETVNVTKVLKGEEK